MTKIGDHVTVADDTTEPPSLLARVNAQFVIRCLTLDTTADMHVQYELLDRLAQELVPVRCRPRAVLCHPGEHPGGLYVIQDGIVEQIAGGADRNVVIQALHRGDVLGVDEIVSDRPSPWLARAASHVSHLFLPRESFSIIRYAYPDLAPHLLSAFAHRLVTASVRLGVVLDGDIEVRTARMLLVEERSGILSVSQSSLAAMTGLSRPSLNRVLKQLCSENTIEISYRQIRILDRHRLTVLAGFDGDQAGPFHDGPSEP